MENENLELQDDVIIKCPHCKYEYLPCEILYPNNVLGYVDKEIRDPLGKIIYKTYKDGKEPLAKESFVCNNCKKPFIVKYKLNVEVIEEEEELDFSKDTVSLW